MPNKRKIQAFQGQVFFHNWSRALKKGGHSALELWKVLSSSRGDLNLVLQVGSIRMGMLEMFAGS